MAPTNLGTLLRFYLRARGLDQRQLAERCFYHPSEITRIIEGKRVLIKHADLVRLAKAASDDRDEQCNLIVAYLLDRCPEEFRGEVDILNARGLRADERQTLPSEVAVLPESPPAQARSA